MLGMITAAKATSALRNGLARLAGRRCLLCADQTSEPVCIACRRSLVINAPCCGHCAMPMAAAASRCGGCHQWPADCAAVFAPLRYQFPLDQVIGRLKYDKDLSVVPALASVLPARPRHWPRVDLVPLPLHRRRLRQRGFNQSALIAQALAQHWRRPLRTAWLTRARETAPQVSLHGKARHNNMRDAFIANRAVRGRRICVVDDVMTSGATALAAAAALRSAGAHSVYVFALARAGYATGAAYK